MQAFTGSVEFSGKISLGGFQGGRDSEGDGVLELNGINFYDTKTGSKVEVISIDALYPGEIADSAVSTHEAAESVKKIFAASHTHYAPMLDKGKPLLGKASTKVINAWEEAVATAERHNIDVTCLNIYRSPVALPIYRRFDYPNTFLNRMLTSKGGMYPNSLQPIDNNIYIFECCSSAKSEFIVVLHCCHPVTRSSRNSISADYIGSIRSAVRQRFGDVPCLFFQGCSGDIRPNFARKRSSFLPRNRLNWAFKRDISLADEQRADRSYKKAVETAANYKHLEISGEDFAIASEIIELKGGGDLELPCLVIAGVIKFIFVPFEVSHLFHLEIQNEQPLTFLVTCADNTYGYLAHPSQLSAGGYEVDSSRVCMGLPNRVEITKGFK